MLVLVLVSGAGAGAGARRTGEAAAACPKANVKVANSATLDVERRQSPIEAQEFWSRFALRGVALVLTRSQALGNQWARTVRPDARYQIIYMASQPTAWPGLRCPHLDSPPWCPMRLPCPLIAVSNAFPVLTCTWMLAS